MRTDKELILYLKHRVETDTIITGICSIIHFNNSITEDEKARARYLINLYKPFFKVVDGYWWESGKRNPRIKFLNKILRKLKRNENR